MSAFDRDAAFVADALAEVASAREQYPGNLFRLAALIEELGEASQALLDFEAGEVPAEAVYEELVQTCAMVIRLATEGEGPMKWRWEMLPYISHSEDGDAV